MILLLVVASVSVLLVLCFFIPSGLECTWYKLDNQQYEEEFKDFLDIVYKTECFLQVSTYLMKPCTQLSLLLRMYLWLIHFLWDALKITILETAIRD